MVSKCIKKLNVNNDITVLLASLLGEAVARDFIAYCKIYTNLPTLKEIVDNPSTVEISTDIGIQWALVGMMTHNMSEDNTDECITFLRRLPIELQVVAIKELNHRQPELRSKLANWKVYISKNYL